MIRHSSRLRAGPLTPGALWIGRGFVSAAEPCPDDITLAAIAAGLSQRIRWGGFTAAPLTVAEHSIDVADMASGLELSADLERVALLHDAHEALLGFDMPTPVKRLCPDVRAIEDRMQAAVWERFGLVEAARELDGIVAALDLTAAAKEKAALIGHDPWPGLPTVDFATLASPLDRDQARDAFLARAIGLGLGEGAE